MDQLVAQLTGGDEVTPAEINRAFWGACDGGQQAAAAHLLERGADVNRVPEWELLTPRDAR